MLHPVPTPIQPLIETQLFLQGIIPKHRTFLLYLFCYELYSLCKMHLKERRIDLALPV